MEIAQGPKGLQLGPRTWFAAPLCRRTVLHTRCNLEPPSHQCRTRVMSVHRLGLERTFCHWSFDCEHASPPPAVSPSVREDDNLAMVREGTTSSPLSSLKMTSQRSFSPSVHIKRPTTTTPTPTKRVWVHPGTLLCETLTAGSSVV